MRTWMSVGSLFRSVPRFLPPAGLVLLPFLFYWKLFVPDPAERRIFRGDFLNQHYVWKSYALEQIKEGHFPLWNSHVVGGAPFHANPQVGLFYPPNYLLLPFLRDGKLNYVALEAFQVLHQGLAGIGMWLLMRSLGVSALGAWTGALVTMFTGFFTTPGQHAQVLTAAWIPLILYCVKRSIETPGPRAVAGTAVAIAMMLLAGHPQPPYYGLLIAGAWALFAGGLSGALTRFLPAAALGIALACVQLLPTYELARDSSREAGTSYAYSASFEFSPFFLPAMLVPRGETPLEGQDISTALHVYVGIGTLILAALGVCTARPRVRWFFIATALLSLVLAMGENSFLFDLAYLVLPGFSRFRVPYRLLGLYAIAMASLAAFGMDSLMAPSKGARGSIAVITRGALVALLSLLAWSLFLQTRLAALPPGPGAAQIERLGASCNWAFLLLALNIAALAALRWPGGRSWASWLVLGLLVVDLGSFVKDRGLHPYSTLARSGERRVTALVKSQQDHVRYATDSNLESYAMLHGTDLIGGQDSLVDTRYASLLTASAASANVLSLLNVKFLDHRGPFSDVAWCGQRFKSPLPLLDMGPEVSPVELHLMPAQQASKLRLLWSPLGSGGRGSLEVKGATYRLEDGTPREVDLGNATPLSTLTLKADEGRIRIHDVELDGRPLSTLSDFVGLGDNIYLNLHCLPRAYFLTGCTKMQEDREADVACWTPVAGALSAACVENASEGARLGRVEVVRYRPEEVVVRASLPESGYLVLADTFRPGWRADVDGREATLVRAQEAFRAVALPAGEHTVRFVYRPRTLYAGGAISLVALAVLGFLEAGARAFGAERGASPWKKAATDQAVTS